MLFFEFKNENETKYIFSKGQKKRNVRSQKNVALTSLGLANTQIVKDRCVTDGLLIFTYLYQGVGREEHHRRHSDQLGRWRGELSR